MPIANICVMWIERTYTPSVIHVSVCGCTVKQAMYRCCHRLISWCATFRYCQMCWLFVVFCCAASVAYSTDLVYRPASKHLACKQCELNETKVHATKTKADSQSSNQRSWCRHTVMVVDTRRLVWCVCNPVSLSVCVCERGLFWHARQVLMDLAISIWRVTGSRRP